MGLVTCFHWPKILMCPQWSLVEVEAWQCRWKQKKRWHEADRFPYMFDSKRNVFSSSLVQQPTLKMQYCWMTACQETGMGMISGWHQTCKLMLFNTKSSVIGLFDQFLDSLRTAVIYQNWFLDFWEPWLYIRTGSLKHGSCLEASFTQQQQSCLLLHCYDLSPCTQTHIRKQLYGAQNTLWQPFHFAKHPCLGFHVWLALPLV